MNATNRRHFLISGASALAASGIGLPALAQTQAAYPSKPILVKIAFPPGGPSDASVRAANVILQRNLGQTVVADNMPGAGGSIAAMFVSRASADGYTLLGTTGTDLLASPYTIASAKYSASDFRLMGVTGISDFVLACSPTLDFKSVDELVKYAKTPGNRQLSIAHWGTGSAAHIVAADFQARTGVKFLEVPYKGVAPSMIDMAGAQVDLGFMPVGGGPTLGMLQNGKLRAIGLAAAVRNPALPDLPIINESKSVPNFEHTLWVGILAPRKTPDDVVERLTAAMNEWTVSPENKARMAANASGRLDPMTPSQADAFLKREADKFARIARAIKLEPQ